MSELKPLDTQIAGHTEEDGGSENLPRFLVSEDGFVFKPIPGKRGEKELEFYTNSHKYNEKLLKFVPKFSKITTVKDIRYLGIENLTYGFNPHRVCVSDIKIGTQTYDDDATDEKIQLEKAKSIKTTTASLGIRFCGAKVVDFQSGHTEKLDKVWGKNLTKDNIYDQGIKRFLDTNSKHEHAVAKEFLSKIQEIEHFFKVNKEFAFYSSSLLFVYGEIDSTITNPTITPIPNSNLGVVVKMIDFAHVCPLKGLRHDDSYIFGIENLSKLFNQYLSSN